MPRYDRVPTGIESSRDSLVPSPGVGEHRIPIEETNSRRNEKVLKRKGSLTVSQSSVSHTSIESHEEDFLNNQGNYDDGDTERSPLHNTRSFASDDGSAGDNDLPINGTTFPLKVPAILPSIVSCYSNSFDLDDDDDDDVKRYSLDFSSTYKVASLTDDSVNDVNEFARVPVNSNRCSKVARYLWFTFQLVRQQARQRRAQLLLQQTERNWRQSLKICVMTNCDATDSGILLVAATAVFWIMALVLISDSTVRRGGTVAGILFFIIRVGTRPLYHFFLRQRLKRQLRHQQLEEIPQTSSGRKMRQSDGHYHHLTHSDGALELHVIRGNINNANRLLATSVGSDPTVAAI